MAGAGRNSRCPCGSGRKLKHCCGERKGPSEEQLERVYVATEARRARRHLAGHDLDEIEGLIDDAVALPSMHAELSVPLPRIVTPDLERVRQAMRSEDWDAVGGVLPAVVTSCDCWAVRARLTRVVNALHDDGVIDECVAAAAIVDLSVDGSELLWTAVFEAAAIDAGVVDTFSGLRVAAAS